MSSILWMYFDLKPSDGSTGICKVCKASISRGSSTKSAKFWGNGALINHLKRFHSSEYRAYEAATKAAEEKKKMDTVKKNSIYT